MEWFRANQIRKTRQRFVEGGRENIEDLVLQRIWSYKEKIFDKKRNKETDRMRNILKHANLEWREQISICARILDPKKSKQDEKEKSWCGSYELGQFDDEMERLSKMVGSPERLEKLCENS